MFCHMGSQVAQLRPDVDPLATLDPVLLDALTQNAYEMVSIIDTGGRILFSGGALESITGFTPEERVGRSCMDFVHPDDADFVRMRTRQFIDDPTIPDHSDSVAARLLHKDGSYRNVEITGTRLSRRGTPALVVVHTRDVTQETRALERSAEAQLQVDVALWGGDLMMWQLDLNTMSLAATGMGSLERRGIDPCIGADSETRWSAQIHPEDRSAVLDAYARQSRGELSRLDLEYRVRATSGAWLWLQERAQIVARNPDGTARRVAGVCACIDEKRQLQQKLDEANERLRLAMRATEITVWDWDVAAGKVRHNLTTYTAEGQPRAPDHDWVEVESCGADIVHQDDRDVARAALDPVLRGERADVMFETRRQLRSSEWRWTLTRGSVVSRNTAGLPTRIVGVIEDVHARHCAEDAMRANEARMRAAFTMRRGYVIDSTHAADGTELSYWVSPGFEELFGCTKPQFDALGGWQRFVHPDDYARTLQKMRSLRPGSSVEVIGRIVRVDGEVRWTRGVHQSVLDRDTGGSRMLSSVYDITDLGPTAGEDQQLQSDIIENVPACIVLLSPELQIRVATRSLFDLPPDELRGRGVLSLFSTEWHEQLREAFARSGREARNVEIEGVVPSQREFASRRYRLHIAPAVSRERASPWCVLIRDVSEVMRGESRAFHALGQDHQRIGHDLREGVGQQLAGVAMLLQSLAAQLARQGHPLSTEAGQIAALINHSVDDVRALSRSLSPVGVAPTGLAVALEGVVEHARNVGTLTVECELDISEDHVICPVDADHLFGIVQEAVSNVLRHAQAEHLWIRISASPARLELEVSDDGRGIDEAAISSAGTRGLALMAHRARGIGATMSFGRRDAGGTSIRCRRIGTG